MHNMPEWLAHGPTRMLATQPIMPVWPSAEPVGANHVGCPWRPAATGRTLGGNERQREGAMKFLTTSDQRIAAGRDGIFPFAGADADRVERRIPAGAANRAAEARSRRGSSTLSDRLAKRQGLSRRRFFQTAAGMAASFVAMNQVFGRISRRARRKRRRRNWQTSGRRRTPGSSSSTATPISCATTRG